MAELVSNRCTVCMKPLQKSDLQVWNGCVDCTETHSWKSLIKKQPLSEESRFCFECGAQKPAYRVIFHKYGCGDLFIMANRTSER